MTTAQPDVTAIIVNYGNGPDCAELANKLQSEVAGTVIVDNSGEIDPQSADFSNIQVIKPETNIGYGAAVNRAAEEANTRWLLVLNPDVRLKRNSLRYLLDASKELNAPVCGPRFFWDDACTLQLPPALGHPLWLLSDRHVPNRNLSEQPNLSTLAIARHQRFWNEQAPFTEAVLSGACLLIDSSWFERNQMPIFDEDFFLYYEDTDLCGRLMRKGVMPVCVPRASVVHYWNQSAEPPEGKAAMMKASEKIFLDKYYPNGAPSLPQTDIDTEFTPLGSFRTSPTLKLSPDTRALDIGVQEDFIVFVRKETSKPEFTFSRSMWRRINDGSYYLRAMSDAGIPLQHWVFEKST